MVSFPLPPGAPLAPAYKPEVAAAAALRILVVEDDAPQRGLLCAVLRHLGVRHLASAADGHAALACLAEGTWDLVISDLSLPGMDGVEFLRRAFALGARRFAIASAADAALVAAVENVLVECGAHVLAPLAKPFAIDAVARLLAQCARALALARTAPAPASGPACMPPPTPARLGAALAAGEFVPYYQPKIDLANGRVLGVEILARWRCPRAGLLPPARFIAAMEDTPLIDGLTEQLLARALADSHAWRAGPISMALNLAPRTMEDPDLPERLLGLARAHGVAAGRITLELTETAMARHPQLVGECATRLRLRGFRFAIDDFGIGYSSMALLLGLPFTELKIDRSFVTRLAGSRKARTMLEAMIALGERLDMEVVAEGVETLDELAMLRALGCPAAQGYLFAPPLSQAGLVAWLARRATAFPVSSFNDEVSHELS